MKRVQKNFTALPIALAVTAISTAPAVRAAEKLTQRQGATPASTQLEDVIITARKTEESQQVVPVSVTALSAEALQQQVVQTVSDLQFSVPGLFISPNSQGGAPTFAIRGAKADNGTSATVAVYIDDVPVASTLAVANMVYDIQSVSTLKGPQGTLFGANSTGGAIIFRPNKPSNLFEGYAEVGFGNYGRQQFQGMVNLPVNEVLQVRVAGEILKRDGFQRNITPLNGVSEYNNDKHESLRLSVRLKPSAEWQNDLVLDYFHKDQQPNVAVDALLRPRYTYATFLGFSVPVDFALAGVAVPRDNRHLTMNTTPTWDKAKLWGLENTTSYEISDKASLKNVIGYRNDRTDASEQNSGGVSIVIADGRTTHNTDQYTEEFSLDVSTDDKRLRNKTGAFFSYLKDGTGNSYHVIGLPFDTTGLPPAAAGALALFYPIGNNSFYNKTFRSSAIYNQISYDLSKELTASFGLRYTWDSATYKTTNRNAFLAPPAFGGTGGLGNWGDFYFGNCSAVVAAYLDYNAAECTGRQSIKSNAPSFNFTLEDRFAERTMVYASIRGGYLVGGFNNQVDDPSHQGQTFKPERVTDFETGIKADWELWGRPIRTNLDIFYGTYKDQQRIQNGQTATGTTFIAVRNAGASTFYGFDFDSTYAVTDNLDLSLAWNHIDAAYTNYLPALPIPGVSAAIDFQHHPVSQTPKDIFTASATVKWPLAYDHGNLFSTLTYFWRAATDGHDAPTISGPVGANGLITSITTDYTAYDHLPSFHLLNFATEWKAIMSSQFDANVWVKNLSDKKYAIYNNNQLLTYGFANFTYGNPREFGVNVRYNF